MSAFVAGRVLRSLSRRHHGFASVAASRGFPIAALAGPYLNQQCRRSLSLWPSSTPKSTDTAVEANTVPPPADVVPPTPLVESSSSAPTLVDSSAAALTPTSPLDTIASMPEITSIIPPLQYGDLSALGLTGWGPTGLITQSLEWINVSTGLPWFHTIILTVCLYRLALFPGQIKVARATSRMPLIQPDLAKLRKEVEAAQAKKDGFKAQELMKKQSSIMKKHGVKMSDIFLYGPVLQMPVAFGTFFAVKHLCEYPLMQLTSSGFSLLPDLAAPNASIVLPALMWAIFQMQIKLSVKDMDMRDREGAMKHMHNGMQLLVLVSMYFLSSMPVGLLVALTATSGTTVLSTAVLRVPAVRKYFGIMPTLDLPKAPTMIDSFKYFFPALAQKLGAKTL